MTKGWIVLMVMAVCVTHCRAQERMDVVPDIVEAITRVVKADDCQKAVQILGEYEIEFRLRPYQH